MGYVLHIVLALVVFAVAEFGPNGPPWQPLPVLGLLATPHLLAWWVHRLALRGRFRLARLLERLLAALPLLGHALVVLVLGWLRVAAAWGGGSSANPLAWPGVELAVGLVPFVVLELLVIDARARVVGLGPRGFREARSLQVRLFLSALLPFAVYLVVTSLIGLDEPLRVHIEEVALLNTGFTCAVVGVFALFLPALLRHTWDTVPIERGALRVVLEEVARQAGFRCRELLLWRTGNQMANAAIVGFTARSRYVLFSDALLAHLGLREVAAVFAHEIGHARRHHALVFLCFALLLLVAADLSFARLQVESVWASGALFAALLFLWYLSFGYLSRRFELDADLASLETLGDSRPLVDALSLVTGAHAHGKSSWRHFSTRQRIEFLRQAERDPDVGRRLRVRLRRWSAVVVVALLVGGAFELRSLVRSVPPERVVAELRLGRYDEAARRARALDADEEERLVTLAERAGELPQDERTPDALEQAALAAASAGGFDEALDFLDLALLRGRQDLTSAWDAVDRLADGRALGAGELEGLAPAWRAALAPADEALR